MRAARPRRGRKERLRHMADGKTDARVAELVEALSGPRRRARQEAAHELAILAHEDASALEPHAEELVDALFRPEAQTRWEVLDALAELVQTVPGKVDAASEEAEASLFDEDSSTVRLAAFRFLARLGARSAARSEQVWPLLDEAVQCYHGDPEYRDMLGCLLEFVRGDVADAVRDSLVDRISFDAKSGRGYIRTCSEEIIEAAKGKA